jgi:hypothetical protein
VTYTLVDDGKVTICHKPGTPAEGTLAIPIAALDPHLGHGDTIGLWPGSLLSFRHPPLRSPTSLPAGRSQRRPTASTAMGVGRSRYWSAAIPPLRYQTPHPSSCNQRDQWQVSQNAARTSGPPSTGRFGLSEGAQMPSIARNRPTSHDLWEHIPFLYFTRSPGPGTPDGL